MNCSSCGRANADGARFCNECAAPLAAGCAACGGENPPGAKFCNHCASPLAARASTPSSAPTERAPRDYTPRHLAEKILQSKSALEGERKRVTVMFADVKGSMELAAQVDAESWHGILDRFFKLLADGVHRFEGTVNQYTGDGIMALFGAPIAHEDHAQRACYAALHLMDVLRSHAREVRREHGLDFGFRIGLNSGEVVVGKIGDDLRMDYTAQGHSVGLAQRMEALAEADSCFMTESTAALVAGYFELEDLGEFRVKGVGVPVRARKLVGMGSARTRFDVSRSRGLTRFVGRHDDMATLEAALEHARAGNGSVVGVVAAAGTGKSRLCFEFVEACRTAGLSVNTGSAVAHGKNIPLVPILEVFRGYFSIGERDDARTAREKIAGRLLLFDEGFRDVLPVLFEFLGVADPANPAPHMEAEVRQRRLIGVSRALLRRTTAERPGLLVVEDLHWLDGSSEAWVREWVDAVAGTHSVLLLNFRPEYHADWMARSHYQQLALAPLGPDAIRELIEALLGNDPSTAGLSQSIYERTGGNPFFAEEVVRSLIESKHLAGAPGAYVLGSRIDRLPVPDSVQALLASRMDRLPEREKRVLQCAAVIGKEFRETVLAQVAGLPAAELADALSRLRSSEFIYEESLYPVAEYAFKHPLTQEVALGSQLREAARNVHAAVACAIEQIDADRLDEQAATLARHWEEAGERASAAAWHARAAAWAMKTDPAQAHGHWVRVRELASELPPESASELMGMALVALINLSWRLRGQVEGTRELFETGRDLFERTGDRRSLCLLHSNYSLAGGLHSSVRVEGYREARRLAAEIGDTSLQIAVGAAVFPGLFAGHVREAAGWADEIVELVESGGWSGESPLHFDPKAWIYSARGFALAALGEVDEALRSSERGLALARDGDPYDLLLAYFIRSTIDGWRGDLVGQLEGARRILELAEQVGGQSSLMLSHGRLGLALKEMGSFAEAVPLLEEARAYQQELDSYMSIAGLGPALLMCGDPDRALSVVREDAEHPARLGHAFAEFELQLDRAFVAGQLGHEAEARAAIARARELSTRMDTRILTPRVFEAEAVLEEKLGHGEARAAALREAQRLFEAAGAHGHAKRIATQTASSND